jgi:uncharacterized protein YeaO (DUF488 family)
MVLRIVRLGSHRHASEGTRIGTVRRPPRGVAKSDFSRKNWYDVWFPNLAPSVELMKFGRSAASDKEWSTFVRRYKAEMSAPDRAHDIQLLATLSHTADLSVGCYCEDENRCHRSVLRELFVRASAKLQPLTVESAA